MPATIALLRVSTDAQDLEPQRLQIAAWARAQGINPEGLDWREEHATSGAATARPVLDAILADARRGRVKALVVVALDRLGRSTVRVLSLVDELHRLGVRVVSLREGIDLASATGRLVAGIFASLAEFERELIRERTRAGLAAAKRRGKRIGRPKLDWRKEDLADLHALLRAGATIDGIARRGDFVIFDTQGRPRRPSLRSLQRAAALP